LEGLEVSEIRLSDLEESFRIDAEYYRPSVLKLEDAITGIQHSTFLMSGQFVPGPFGSEFHVENYEDQSGYRYIRGKDVKPFFLQDEDNVYIPKVDFERLQEFSLKEGDILISVVGTLGNASIVTSNTLPSIYSCKSTVFRSTSVNAWFLVAYLNSSYGKQLLLRKTRGTVQTGLNLPDLKSVLIPKFSPEFETLVSRFVKSAQTKIQESKRLYSKSENILLSELDLLNWQPPEPLTYERKAREAFKAKRFDAEYYQPKYDALFALLAAKGDLRLGDYVTEPIKRGISPEYVEEGGDTIVINSKHVGKTHVEVEDNRRTMRVFLEVQDESAEGVEKALKRGEVKVGDVLLNSTGMITIGRCQCLLDDVSAVVDNHVAIIRPKQGIDPVYLACFLNTLPGQMQTERGWTGSSGQIELRPDVIADYRIWKAPPEVQQQIRSLIGQSHTSRKQAKRLLENAKRAVEIAIEASEAAAIGFLNSEA
jgi:hypothetical protein